ncbi:MAG: serine/threonine protein kinase [Acidobacteria bacterium]|nr:serine/threonine protein kinase [Acidobacteriota bacterium]MCB9399724.1 serine/threonine protein kinase [Acidobacteriota bacterium]
MATALSKLGRYQILGVLGKGSMGVVYKGMDPQINKLVAIKTMNQKHLSDPNMQERFYREGNVLGQLHHRNIINVYNVGEDQDTCYIAMEYLDGTTLERQIRAAGGLSMAKSLEVVRQVCEGVHAAHQRGIIHRDLKPANIFLLNEDHVKVLDFGVAHFKNSQLTTSGVVIGTINYIAPEQITGLKIDHRADIFSIGVILYELLAHKHPFEGKNISQTMVRIINDEPPPIPDLPKSINEIVKKALSKDRDFRYGDCKTLSDDLEQVIRTESMVDTLHDEKIVDEDLMKAQQSYIRKLVEERIGTITIALKNEKIEEAEQILTQLKGLAGKNEITEDLTKRIRDAKRKREQKLRFVSQLTHETLLKANQFMDQRHYVSAVENCMKVLEMDPKNQDARIIKARCIKQLQAFLEQVEDKTPPS